MRLDIQFLRGYAVAIVILIHAGIGPTAGFLGVDIFFVISGYLMTRLIQNQLVEGRFSFSEFYARRAKRLLPAAFVTFALTSVAAPFFLSSLELDAYWKQLVGALTFTANFALLAQSGYFDAASELKPLLHIWSLSIEEQYYFLLPLLLFLVRKRFWPHVTAALLIFSAAYCLYWVGIDPSYAFYTLFSRAWELSVGSMVALLALDRNPHRISRGLFWPAMATLFIIPVFPTQLPHPGLDAVLVCLATAVVIINGRSFFGTLLPFRGVAWVGDASYSLYLTHWPVMAFVNNAYLGHPPLEARIISLLVGIVLGFALYYLIERPIHKSEFRPRLPLTVAIAAPLALLTFVPILVAGMLKTGDGIDFTALRKPNVGLGAVCDQGREPFKPLPECLTGPNPTVAVWGDSFAMHLVDGILASTDATLVQITRSSCPPAFGYAQFNNASRYTEDWAHRCVDFNRAVLKYLASTPSIETVVIGSTFRAFTMGGPWQAIVYGKGRAFSVEKINRNLSVRVLRNSINTLRDLGKKVVLVSPPPSSGANVSDCVERVVSGIITFGNKDCIIESADDLKYSGDVLSLLKAVSEQASVPLIDPRGWMCSDGRCATVAGQVPLYRDATHLSVEGSKYLGNKFDWKKEIIGAAR